MAVLLLLATVGCANEQSAAASSSAPLSHSPADRDAQSGTAAQPTAGPSTPVPTARSSAPRATSTAGPTSHTLAHAPQQSSSASVKRAPDAVASPAPSPSPFLAVGACTGHRASTGDSFVQLACSSSSALAVVIARLAVGRSAVACPGGTDFALDVSMVRAVGTTGATGKATGSGGAGSGTSTARHGTVTTPGGVACLRNLRAPHPGDPGGGGGFGIVPGDCMYGTGRTAVRETACDGSGGHRPGYRVLDLVTRDRDCPKGTDVFITVHNPGSPAQVACSVQLHQG